MRAILIDPKEQTITEVEYNGDYKHINTLIDARCFDCVRLGDKDENTIYVDDEGLMNGTIENVGMFRVDGHNPAYLAGKGLILATDKEGESVACTLDIKAFADRIAFGLPARTAKGMVFQELRNMGIARVLGRQWPIDN